MIENPAGPQPQESRPRTLAENILVPPKLDKKGKSTDGKFKVEKMIGSGAYEITPATDSNEIHDFDEAHKIKITKKNPESKKPEEQSIPLSDFLLENPKSLLEMAFEGKFITQKDLDTEVPVTSLDENGNKAFEYDRKTGKPLVTKPFSFIKIDGDHLVLPKNLTPRQVQDALLLVFHKTVNTDDFNERKQSNGLNKLLLEELTLDYKSKLKDAGEVTQESSNPTSLFTEEPVLQALNIACRKAVEARLKNEAYRKTKISQRKGESAEDNLLSRLSIAAGLKDETKRHSAKKEISEMMHVRTPKEAGKQTELEYSASIDLFVAQAFDILIPADVRLQMKRDQMEADATLDHISRANMIEKIQREKQVWRMAILKYFQVERSFPGKLKIPTIAEESDNPNIFKTDEVIKISDYRKVIGDQIDALDAVGGFNKLDLSSVNLIKTKQLLEKTVPRIKGEKTTTYSKRIEDALTNIFSKCADLAADAKRKPDEAKKLIEGSGLLKGLKGEERELVFKILNEAFGTQMSLELRLTQSTKEKVGAQVRPTDIKLGTNLNEGMKGMDFLYRRGKEEQINKKDRYKLVSEKGKANFAIKTDDHKVEHIVALGGEFSDEEYRKAEAAMSQAPVAKKEPASVSAAPISKGKTEGGGTKEFEFFNGLTEREQILVVEMKTIQDIWNTLISDKKNDLNLSENLRTALREELNAKIDKIKTNAQTKGDSRIVISKEDGIVVAGRKISEIQIPESFYEKQVVEDAEGLEKLSHPKEKGSSDVDLKNNALRKEAYSLRQGFKDLSSGKGADGQKQLVEALQLDRFQAVTKVLGFKSEDIWSKKQMIEVMDEAGFYAEGSNMVKDQIRIDALELKSTEDLETLSTLSELFPDAQIKIDSLNLIIPESEEKTGERFIIRSSLNKFNIEKMYIRSGNVDLTTLETNIGDLQVDGGFLRLFTDGNAPQGINLFNEAGLLVEFKTKEDLKKAVFESVDDEKMVVVANGGTEYSINITGNKEPITVEVASDDQKSLVIIEQDGAFDIVDFHDPDFAEMIKKKVTTLPKSEALDAKPSLITNPSEGDVVQKGLKDLVLDIDAFRVKPRTEAGVRLFNEQYGKYLDRMLEQAKTGKPEAVLAFCDYVTSYSKENPDNLGAKEFSINLLEKIFNSGLKNKIIENTPAGLALRKQFGLRFIDLAVVYSRKEDLGVKEMTRLKDVIRNIGVGNLFYESHSATETKLGRRTTMLTEAFNNESVEAQEFLQKAFENQNGEKDVFGFVALGLESFKYHIEPPSAQNKNRYLLVSDEEGGKVERPQPAAPSPTPTPLPTAPSPTPTPIPISIPVQPAVARADATVTVAPKPSPNRDEEQTVRLGNELSEAEVEALNNLVREFNPGKNLDEDGLRRGREAILKEMEENSRAAREESAESAASRTQGLEAVLEKARREAAENPRDPKTAGQILEETSTRAEASMSMPVKKESKNVPEVRRAFADQLAMEIDKQGEYGKKIASELVNQIGILFGTHKDKGINEKDFIEFLDQKIDVGGSEKIDNQIAINYVFAGLRSVAAQRDLDRDPGRALYLFKEYLSAYASAEGQPDNKAVKDFSAFLFSHALKLADRPQGVILGATENWDDNNVFHTRSRVMLANFVVGMTDIYSTRGEVKRTSRDEPLNSSEIFNSSGNPIKLRTLIIGRLDGHVLPLMLQLFNNDNNQAFMDRLAKADNPSEFHHLFRASLIRLGYEMKPDERGKNKIVLKGGEENKKPAGQEEVRKVPTEFEHSRINNNLGDKIQIIETQSGITDFGEKLDNLLANNKKGLSYDEANSILSEVVGGKDTIFNFMIKNAKEGKPDTLLALCDYVVLKAQSQPENKRASDMALWLLHRLSIEQFNIVPVPGVMENYSLAQIELRKQLVARYIDLANVYSVRKQDSAVINLVRKANRKLSGVMTDKEIFNIYLPDAISKFLVSESKNDVGQVELDPNLVDVFNSVQARNFLDMLWSPTSPSKKEKDKDFFDHFKVLLSDLGYHVIKEKTIINEGKDFVIGSKLVRIQGEENGGAPTGNEPLGSGFPSDGGNHPGEDDGGTPDTGAPSTVDVAPKIAMEKESARENLLKEGFPPDLIEFALDQEDYQKFVAGLREFNFGKNAKSELAKKFKKKNVSEREWYLFSTEGEFNPFSAEAVNLANDKFENVSPFKKTGDGRPEVFISLSKYVLKQARENPTNQLAQETAFHFFYYPKVFVESGPDVQKELIGTSIDLLATFLKNHKRPTLAMSDPYLTELNNDIYMDKLLSVTRFSGLLIDKDGKLRQEALEELNGRPEFLKMIAEAEPKKQRFFSEIREKIEDKKTGVEIVRKAEGGYELRLTEVAQMSNVLDRLRTDQ